MVSSPSPATSLSTASRKSPLRSPSCRMTTGAASSPIVATPGPSSLAEMVASSESSPAAQALPTRPTFHTSHLSGGLSNRSRPSTSAASSTRSSNRDVASWTSFTVGGLFSAELVLSFPQICSFPVFSVALVLSINSVSTTTSWVSVCVGAFPLLCSFQIILTPSVLDI